MMNYIWEVLNEADNKGIEQKQINFEFSEMMSPYFELPFSIDSEMRNIDVSPFYRLFNLFSNNTYKRDKENEYFILDEEKKKTIENISLHLIAFIESINQYTYYDFIVFSIIKDFENGGYGGKIQKLIKEFSKDEKYYLAKNEFIINNSGYSIKFLIETIKNIFDETLFYNNKKEENTLIVFINRKETEKNQKKLELIKELFLPINVNLKVFWEYHFGIIGEDNTMKIDKIKIL